MLKDKIFIVIPSLNEERHVEEILKKVRKFGMPIVLVDDGSNDKTFEIGSKIADYSVRHKVNLGKGAALKTGCLIAFKEGAQAVILMDSDGQHSPKDIAKFARRLSRGYDVVFGLRKYNKAVPLVRFLGNRLASLLILFLYRIEVGDLLCGFRGLTKKAFKKIAWESSGYGVETEMVIKTATNHLRYCQVQVATIYIDRTKGVTILDAFSILTDVLRWRVKL